MNRRQQIAWSVAVLAVVFLLVFLVTDWARGQVIHSPPVCNNWDSVGQVLPDYGWSAVSPQPAAQPARPQWQWSPAAAHHRAIVQVSAVPRQRPDGKTEWNGGSGTLIWSEGGEGVVLTCAHVVESEQTATATWPDGYRSAGRVLGRDRESDLAAFTVAPPRNAVTIPVAGNYEYAKAGATVELVGYGVRPSRGHGQRLAHWFGNVQDYVVKGNSDYHHTMRVNCTTMSGDSGGAMIYRGRLVGVIWGGGPDIRAHATCCVSIRPFLSRVFPRAIVAKQPCGPQRQQPVPPAPRPRPPEGLPGNVPVPACPDLSEIRADIAAMREAIRELREVPTPPSGDIIEIRAEIASIAGAIEILRHEIQQMPAGADGEDGKDGEDGIDGIDGKEVDPAIIRDLNLRIKALEDQARSGPVYYDIVPKKQGAK